MAHGGFHAPSGADKRRAEIKRLRKLIAKYETELAKIEGNTGSASKSMRGMIERCRANATALVEHLEEELLAS